jgi:FMN phosphatase YigB (HAD superfamily)
MTAARASLASFDVFDTVVTRACGSPSSAFLLVGRAALREGLLPASMTPQAFAEARARAEGTARNWAAGGECTLAQVYEELGFSLGLEAGARARLAELEMEIEARLLRPAPSGAALVAEARAAGSRVAFVSDTYLPSAFLGRVLTGHGIMRAGDLLFVSCEHGASKYGGTLFPLVLKAAGVAPRDCLHTGDNPRSDVAMARRRGLKVRHLTDAHPTRGEIAMEAHAGATGGVASLFAGAARAARLDLKAAGEGDVRLATAGAEFAGPVLGAYCLWFLARARARGVRRLYLLSRDGEVLIEVARELCRRLGWDLELRYLYASRQGWHLPGVVTLGARHRSWLLERTDSSTPRRMLSRVEIRPEDFEGVLTAAGVGRERWDTLATPSEVRALDAALEDPGLKGAIERNGAERRAVVLDYFRQEGLLDGTPWAIVDVGWHGRLQHSLASILGTVNGPSPVGYYMGLRGGHVEAGVGAMEAFLFDARRRAGRRFPGYEYDAMVELFCAARHGTLKGYRREGGRVVPVLKEERNASALGWGLESFRAGMVAFAKRVALEEAGDLAGVDLRPMVWDVLRTLIETPGREEAAAIGSFPFDTDQSGETQIPMGRALRVGDVMATLVPRARVLPPWGFWKAGAFALSPAPLRWGVMGAEGAWTLARRVRDRVRPKRPVQPAAPAVGAVPAAPVAASASSGPAATIGVGGSRGADAA